VIQVSSIVTFLLSLAIWFIKDRISVSPIQEIHAPNEREPIAVEKIVQEENILLIDEKEKDAGESSDGYLYNPQWQ